MMTDLRRYSFMFTNEMDIDKLMREALFYDKEFTDKIIQLNTEEQLYKKGIDSTGMSLEKIGGGYSPYTIQLKEEKGQPTDRVTLKDTGEFYESFKIYLDNNFDLEIYANPIKGTTNLLVEWGENILGLTEENLSILRDMAKEKCLLYLRKKIAA